MYSGPEDLKLITLNAAVRNMNEIIEIVGRNWMFV